MTEFQEKAIAAIEAQQAKVKERSPQWMVGEQLKGICRHEPRSAGLIAQDLAAEAMSITEAEKKIKAFADKHKTGNFACVIPAEADRILREFYGLAPAPGDGPSHSGAGIGNRALIPASPFAEPSPGADSGGRIDPLDFL